MSSAGRALHPLGCMLFKNLLADNTPSSFLFRNQPTPTTMSSSNKSTSLSVSDILRFNGRNFQGWVEKMIGVFMMAKVYNVVNGTTTKPADTEVPVAPTEPPEIAATADSTMAL